MPAETTPPILPTAPPLQPTRQRSWRLALLGLIGVLALVLPLAQVLRFQVETLIEDRHERNRLDPLTKAVAVQRGLIGHDELAAQVLLGRTALEGERRLRQAEVDQSLRTLKLTLYSGAWQRARREAQALQADWLVLAGHISSQRVNAETSRRGHRLLQEQAVQVMDFVQAQLSVPLGRADSADLQARLELRQRELDSRIARTESTLALLALSMLTALAGAGLALRAGLRTELRGAAAARAQRQPADDIRRSAGRRVGDRPRAATPAEVAAASLDSARRQEEEKEEDKRSRQ